jgi:hypothetical protein
LGIQYSRVLGNLAYSILSRIRDILKEDGLSNPNSLVVMPYFDINHYETLAVGIDVRHSLIDQMNKLHRHYCDSNSSSASSYSEAKASSVAATPSWNRLWCIDKEIQLYEPNPKSF